MIKKDPPAVPPCEFFHVYIINKYSCGIFSFSLKLICSCEFSEIAVVEVARAISCFLETRSYVQINSKLNSKPYGYLYSQRTQWSTRGQPRYFIRYVSRVLNTSLVNNLLTYLRCTGLKELKTQEDLK